MKKIILAVTLGLALPMIGMAAVPEDCFKVFTPKNFDVLAKNPGQIYSYTFTNPNSAPCYKIEGGYGTAVPSSQDIKLRVRKNNDGSYTIAHLYSMSHITTPCTGDLSARQIDSIKLTGLAKNYQTTTYGWDYGFSIENATVPAGSIATSLASLQQQVCPDFSSNLSASVARKKGGSR